MAKLERLLNLTAALLHTDVPLTAEQLRRRIEGYPESDVAFHRSFERDKDDLREMGIPISLEPVGGSDPPVEGYRIRKADYYMEDPGLAADELAAIHLAASAVRMDGLSGAEALRKLGGTTAASVEVPLASVPTDPNLSVFFDAVAKRSVAMFDYKGSRREVEPWRLDFVRGRWYVTGFDRSRADERHFRLDRMESSVTVGPPASFERHPGAAGTDRPSGVRLEPWQLGDDPLQLAKVRVDPDQASWARHHVSEDVEELDDGSVVLDLAVTNEAAFLSFVLTFLDHAEILEPASLRTAMIDWLTELAK